MSVPEVVRAEVDAKVGRFDRWLPDVVPEPGSRDVAVGVDGAETSGGILAGFAPAGAVVGVDVLTALAAALACGIPAQRPVSVTALGLDKAEGFRVEEDA